MNNYKSEITLNEKDSLQDMLNVEKAMVKLYSTALTEGCSKGFRTLVKENFSSTIEDQFKVFAMMTEQGYYQVESAPEEPLKEQRENFSSVKSQLS